jgi:hypothetical protein
VEIVNEEKSSDHIPQKGVYGRQDKECDFPDIPPDDIYGDIGGTPEKTDAPYPPFRITCSKEAMLKGGNINNTGFSNTELSNNRGYKSISLPPIAGAKENDEQMDVIRNKLKSQIDYSYFEDNFPEDVAGVNVLIDCMAEMLISPYTKINGSTQLQSVLKPYIDNADSESVKGFLDHMRGKPMRNVKNVSAYFRSSFINYLRDEQLVLQTV